jgi:glycosidase
MNYSHPAWLDRAIGYQIYPQSYQDSNGDGIGDLPGILSRVDDLADLGVNLVWLSPIYDSPFLDAGYDVRDFKKVAPRYGTLEDLERLIEALHALGIRLMLDLVPGHTSIDHPWFLESCKHEPNPYTNRYVWTNSMYQAPKGSGQGFLQGYGEREGAVAVNFFWSQPKLNYGVLTPDPSKPWEMPFDHPDVQALWTEMFNIIRFWLDRGVDGFRIDSAKSICPDRPPLGEGRFYRELRGIFDREYPDAALLTEWGWPCDALATGVHADFLLHNNKAFNELFSLPGWENGVPEPVFSDQGGDVARFYEHYLPHHRQRHGGVICMMSGNHDYMRCGTSRSIDQLKGLFTFLYTMPALPMIYYGDEVGMPNVMGLISKEGGYRRTGCRTPMQWDAESGFSTAPREDWYLPPHTDPGNRTVAAQKEDPQSLRSHVQRLIQLRRSHPALEPDADWEPLLQEGPTLLYRRGQGENALHVLVHPPLQERELELPTDLRGKELIAEFSQGVTLSADGIRLHLGPSSFAMW